MLLPTPAFVRQTSSAQQPCNGPSYRLSSVSARQPTPGLPPPFSSSSSSSSQQLPGPAQEAHSERPSRRPQLPPAGPLSGGEMPTGPSHWPCLRSGHRNALPGCCWEGSRSGSSSLCALSGARGRGCGPGGAGIPIGNSCQPGPTPFLQFPHCRPHKGGTVLLPGLRSLGPRGTAARSAVWAAGRAARQTGSWWHLGTWLWRRWKAPPGERPPGDREAASFTAGRANCCELMRGSSWRARDLTPLPFSPKEPRSTTSPRRRGLPSPEEPLWLSIGFLAVEKASCPGPDGP